MQNLSVVNFLIIRIHRSFEVLQRRICLVQLSERIVYSLFIFIALMPCTICLQHELRDIKNLHHLTYKQIASALNVHWSTVRYWIIKDKLRCRIDRLPKLLRYLIKKRSEYANRNLNAVDTSALIMNQKRLLTCYYFAFIFYKKFSRNYTTTTKENIRKIHDILLTVTQDLSAKAVNKDPGTP